MRQTPIAIPSPHIAVPMSEIQITKLLQKALFRRSGVKYSQWGMAPTYAPRRELVVVCCTTSPVVLNKFQVRYSNVPGSTSPPFQPLDVWYISGYAQDEWGRRAT